MRSCWSPLALASAIVLVAGCAQDATAPKPDLNATNTGGTGGDFTYVVNPPHVRVTDANVTPQAIPFCNTSGGPLICYTPKFLRSAYNYPTTLDGTGQTIVIVDAYGSPTIKQDLATFDQTFAIPDPPSFDVVCPQGCPTFNAHDPFHDQPSWSLETSLDVEYAHAMAPGARIVLVVAASSSGNAINEAETAAIQQYPGSIMSQSFGIPEGLVKGNNAQLMQAHKNYVAALHAGITVLASAGDFGATNGLQTTNASFPASDSLVTAVGGTQGHPDHGSLVQLNGSNQPIGYGGEAVWNEPVFDAAGGGAPSLLIGLPSYQQGLGLTKRTVPDVAYNAAINGGVLVLDRVFGGFFIVGGTSAGSPQWAAIIALANQQKGSSLGFVNPTLYAIGCSAKYAQDFHDITIGDNKLDGTQPGFSAGTGWDDATGLGTPNVANLIPDLVTPPTCS